MSNLRRALFSSFGLSLSLLSVPLDARADPPWARCIPVQGLVSTVSSAWHGSHIVFIDSGTGESYRVNRPEVLRSHLGHTITVVGHLNKNGLFIIHGDVRCSEHSKQAPGVFTGQPRASSERLTPRGEAQQR